MFVRFKDEAWQDCDCSLWWIRVDGAMSKQTLGQILKTRTQGQNSTFNVSDDWTQGRSVYGGVIAALAHESMHSLVTADRPLRALQIALAAPNAPGIIAFENEIIREGKSVTTLLSRVSPGGATTGLVTGIYGAPRKSSLSFEPLPSKAENSADQFSDLIAPEGMAPNFFEHFQYRYSSGGVPYSGSQERSFTAYVRFLPNEVDCFNLSHLLALTDALPTPALSMLEGVFPASTLSWTIEIMDASVNFSPEQWWWIDAELDSAGEGYTTYTLYLVNPEHRVAAISRQVNAVFG